MIASSVIQHNDIIANKKAIWKHNRFFHALAICFFIANVAFSTLCFVYREHNQGIDLWQRYNEVLCVRSGVDPYLVWCGEVKSSVFYSYNGRAPRIPSATRPVNAYPPWEYTLLWPLSRLGWNQAWRIYRTIEIIALLTLGTFSFHRGRRLSGTVYGGFFTAGSALFVGIGMWRVSWTDNFGVLLSLAVFLLAEAEERRQESVGGMLLAFLMVKPQIGILFLPPLLLRCRFKTCLCGAFICFVATIPPSIRLRTSPIALILQIPKYGSDVAHGSCLLPGPCFKFLEPIVGQTTLIIFNAIIGLGVCCFICWRLRKQSDWLLFLAPVVLWSAGWTYSADQDRVLWSIVQIVLAGIALTVNARRDVVLACLCIFLLGASSAMSLHWKIDNCWTSLLGLNVIRGRHAQVLYGFHLLCTWLGLVVTSFFLWTQGGVGYTSTTRFKSFPFTRNSLHPLFRALLSAKKPLFPFMKRKSVGEIRDKSC